MAASITCDNMYYRSFDVVEQLLDQHRSVRNLGTMSCTIYDTAWIACISKTTLGMPKWLFPSLFQLILDWQHMDGEWPTHFDRNNPGTVTDWILANLAALYCVTKHAKQPDNLDAGWLLINGCPRVALAVDRLGELLQSYRMQGHNALDFEMLAPRLLELLEGEQSLSFDFPAKKGLFEVRDRKLALVVSKRLGNTVPVSLLHSLEAFHHRRDFNFDNVAKHKVDGGIMASPAATASYLIRASKWDDEAEAYLRRAIADGDGSGSGAAPGVFPTDVFEVATTVSTLLEAKVWDLNFDPVQRDMVLDIIDKMVAGGGGLVGFASGIEPDSDDSAKVSLVYSLCGRSSLAPQIIDRFDATDCLQWYAHEREPCVSANAQALLALTHDTAKSEQNAKVVEKITKFLCASWARNRGWLIDKRSHSPYYQAMLLIGAWSLVVEHRIEAEVVGLQSSPVAFSVLPSIVAMVDQTLDRQNEDGSWGIIGPKKETAYAILALASVCRLARVRKMRPTIFGGVNRGRAFLRTHRSDDAEYLWVGKTSFGSKNLLRAYRTAALHVPLE